MLALGKKWEKVHFTWLCNALVALFFVMVLSVNKGYSYVPMTLGAIATLMLLVSAVKRKVNWVLDKEDKWLIFSLIGYFLTFVLSVLFNHDGIRAIDNPSRILLLIPLLFLFRHFPLKKETFFYAVPVGALIVGCLAAYQKFALHLPKPFPETMHIQAGNIAITLGLFSLVIAFYGVSQRKYAVAIGCTLCAAFGFLASILSGVRGGWIALPACVLLIFAPYIKQISKKVILLIATLITIALSVFIANPEFGITERYQQAESDIVEYLEKGNKTSSLGARFDMWENALVAISEKPLLGHGNNGYETFKQAQIAAHQMAETTAGFNSLHNQFLESFVKRGVIGFVALLAILLVPLIIFAKRLNAADSAVKCIALLGTVHIVAHSFFFLSQSFLMHNSGSIFYFFILLLLYHLLKQGEETK